MADVPAVPGVPSIVSNPVGDIGLSLASGDAAGVLSQLGSQTWGVFQGGSPVITADTVASMEYRQEWTISDFPIEQGGFQSYDKVQAPFSARVSFAAGGSEASRMALLQSVAAIAGDLNLYDVATRTATYSNANVVHYDYRITTQNGVGLLVVDVWLMEVRVVAASSSTGNNAAGNTASASGADATNGGTVQGQSPSTTQSVQAGTASETAASAQVANANAFNAVTTPLPATLGGGVGGLPVSNPSAGGIGKA